MENKELFMEANKIAIATAIEMGLDTEEGRALYKMAMDGIDRENRIEEQKLKKKDSKVNAILRCIEIGGTILLVPVIDFIFKDQFAHTICNFEKDYSFTTTAGRTLGSLFRFKK